MSSGDRSTGEASGDLSAESVDMASTQGSNNQSYVRHGLQNYRDLLAQSADLFQIVVRHGGMFLEEIEKGVDYAGGKTFYIHNVDPERFKVARLLQLVLKDQDEGEQKPTRLWYTEYESLWPDCVKPLHTAANFRDMIANAKTAGTNWCRVYLQSVDQITGADGHIIYALPPPLSFVQPFEGIENLYDHAAHIQQTINALKPATRQSLEIARIWPYVSRHG